MLHKITYTLVIIGGLNWLLEAFHQGVGHWISSWPVVMTIYLIIGISAVIELFTHKSNCKNCAAGPAKM